MKKKLFTLAAIIVAIFALYLILPVSPLHAPAPETPEDNLVRLNDFQPGQLIESPFALTGQARGTWFFEDSFPVELLDDQGRVLVQTPAQAQADWMTEDFVPFSVTLDFIPASATGTLVLKKDNPSGLPENDDERRFPVKFKTAETQTVQVYFGNDQTDPGIMHCERTYPAVRAIAQTPAVARAALEELLKGPTASEQAQGFLTSLPAGVAIQSLTIENRVARVDFNEALEFQVGGSCRVAAIVSQITNTLLQFSTVDSVVISINGRTQDILQP
ncbi:GerMN domain-containing protein [Patescibacteria group bacterium]|nr:GerMN domain-containing protein [Patescibacteria group bacterium]